MPGDSAIEWTDKTWNPVTGCLEVSPGCDHCYARTFAERWRGVPGHPYEQGFDLRLWPERLEQPLRWKKPCRVFVNSMSDLFHADVPDEFIGRVFDVMEDAHWHTFQVLTKRPQRMMRFVNQRWGAEGWFQPQFIWLGVSIESDAYTWRANFLRRTNAAVRFISAEPLLGPLPSLNLDGIHWLITGGESGHGARSIQVEWVRDLRDRCQEAGVAFFHKQWGGRTPKAGGRLLDGVEWSQFPA